MGASSSDHPLSSSAENPAPAPEESVKWKRGAEAEAILKLLSETKDAMDAEAAGHASAEGSSAPPAPEMVDAEAIMKTLGPEEPGIKLPEKAHNGDEKALDPVSELQLTERNFIADLGLLNETFIKPIRTNHILPDSTVDDMALNLDRLISLHRDFTRVFCRTVLSRAFQILFLMKRFLNWSGSTLCIWVITKPRWLFSMRSVIPWPNSANISSNARKQCR